MTTESGVTDEALSEIELLIIERKFHCLHNSTQETFKLDKESSVEKSLTCPRVFDGWSCWNETKAGEIAYEPCPYFVFGFDPKRFGHKACLSDGTWFKHPATNITWSNYTTCVDIDDLEKRQTVITIHEVGYLISVCALILSLVIFCSFRCLECTRVRIHKHLFVSFIINNVLWLLWYRTVVTQPDALNNSPGYCIVLHIFLQYFLVANYFWMFCEGFYLHTLIVFTFTRAEGKLLLSFYIFGWLGPILPITLYAIFRSLDPLENSRCWINDETVYKWFLSVPVCICLVSSLVFLINILRILLNKLNANSRRGGAGVPRRESTFGDHNQNAIQKAAKATLILVPLLGLHYLLTPFRPNRGSDGEIIYEYITAVSMSLQGLCVSLLFCFCNGEVRSVLRRKFCSTFCPGKSNRADYSCAPTSMSMMIIRRQSEVPPRSNLNLSDSGGGASNSITHV